MPQIAALLQQSPINMHDESHWQGLLVTYPWHSDAEHICAAVLVPVVVVEELSLGVRHRLSRISLALVRPPSMQRVFCVLQPQMSRQSAAQRMPSQEVICELWSVGGDGEMLGELVGWR